MSSNIPQHPILIIEAPTLGFRDVVGREVFLGLVRLQESLEA